VQAASSWLYVYPRGLRELLLYIKIKYKNPVIYITENGNTLNFKNSIYMFAIVKNKPLINKNFLMLKF